MRAPEDVRKYLDEDLFKLYQLIWQRFVASQMLPAIFDQTTIDIDRKSTRLNSSHGYISYAVFCLKKKELAQCYNVLPQLDINNTIDHRHEGVDILFLQNE